MSGANENEPAFPAPDAGEKDFGDRGFYSGMSLRDYFAARAMQSIWQKLDPHSDMWAENMVFTARNAYAMADAMLRARAQPGGQVRPGNTEAQPS